jgi:hypothetical protein
LAEEILQRFRAGGVFLDVDAGFFAQDEAEQCLEDAAVALWFAGFAAVADEEAAWDERLDALGEAVGEDVERIKARVAVGANFLRGNRSKNCSDAALSASHALIAARRSYGDPAAAGPSLQPSIFSLPKRGESG